MLVSFLETVSFQICSGIEMSFTSDVRYVCIALYFDRASKDLIIGKSNRVHGVHDCHHVALRNVWRVGRVTIFLKACLVFSAFRCSKSIGGECLRYKQIEVGYDFVASILFLAIASPTSGV